MKVFHKANIYFLVLGHRLYTVLLIGYLNTKVIIQEPWDYFKKQTQSKGNYDKMQGAGKCLHFFSYLGSSQWHSEFNLVKTLL